MRWWFGRKAWLFAIAGVVLLLVTNGAVFYANTRTIVDGNAEVIYTQTVMSTLDHLLIAATDADDWQRGYVLTGQDSYLHPYTTARQQIGNLLGSLKDMVRDDAVQERHVSELTGLFPKLYRSLDMTIELRQTKGVNAAVSIILTGQPSSIMAQIRNVLAAMDQKETSDLNDNLAAVDRVVNTTKLTLVLATAADIVLLSGLVFLLQRNVFQAARLAEERKRLLYREQAARAEVEHERQLAQLERSRLEALFEAMTEAVIVYDRDGNILQENAAMRTLAGVDASPGLLNRSPHERYAQWDIRDEKGQPFPPEQWPVHQFLSGRVVTARDAIDLLAQAADGREVVLAVSGAPLYNDAGEIIGAISVLRDETERRRLARAVQSERDRLRQILAVLPEAVMIVDTTPMILINNQTASVILGMDLVGDSRSIADPGEPDSRGKEQLAMTPFFAPGQPLERSVVHGEVVYGAQLDVRNVAEGRDIPILANTAPIRDEHGAIIGGVVVFQDISAIKDLEQQKDDFLATAAHDLKNPLTVISGQAQILLRRAARLERAEQEGRISDGLATINRTARNMTQQIGELLDTTQLQMGKELKLDLQLTNLAELLGDLVREYAQASQQHMLKLQTDRQALVAMSDRPRLYRALANVLTNAIKYSPQGGEITLALTASAAPAGQNRATIRIIDHGLGIPASELPHIFDRYFRADNVRHQISGTGIGLAGVKQVIEQLGGSITVDSVEGVGTTVTIQLPLIAHEGQNEASDRRS
ncbi:MAG: multi-sensor signal transduction histidine kinase [Chloroflexi bacterium]|nr:multi-sensor signal transduction histidine kinase [Chloroflexota bacterium]